MTKDEVINKLRAHEPELKAAGIVRLAVFGSVARGDNSPDSDVDLLADFDTAKRYTLLTMGRLENRLADLLGARVDLSSPEWLKESLRIAFCERRFLPSREPERHLRDILESIDRIDEFIGDMTFTAYQRDEKKKAAVERKMQIVTEAVIRLEMEGPEAYPEIDWKGYRGMGNFLAFLPSSR